VSAPERKLKTVTTLTTMPVVAETNTLAARMLRLVTMEQNDVFDTDFDQSETKTFHVCPHL